MSDRIHGIIAPEISNDVVGEQFSREEDLNRTFTSIENAAVIGLGGIGGSVAEILGTLSSIRNLILIDDDEIEMSNLNRTIYTYVQIGALKIEAAAKLISSRNINVAVYPIPIRFNESTSSEVKVILESVSVHRSNYIYVFDCRDDDYNDYELWSNMCRDLDMGVKILRAAYNGMSMTLDLQPQNRTVFGRGGYENIASHSIPSRLIATLIVLYAGYYIYLEEEKPIIFNTPITFDAKMLPEMLFYAHTLMATEPNVQNRIKHKLVNTL